MTAQNTVRYWHAVELLQPQAAPKLKKRDSDYQPYFQDVPSSAQILPWMPANALNRQRLPPKRTWSHTLYAHLYDNLDVARQLERLFGADQGYKEPQRRTSALFALKFNDRGMMLADSLVLSSEAWFVGCAGRGRRPVARTAGGTGRRSAAIGTYRHRLRRGARTYAHPLSRRRALAA